MFDVSRGMVIRNNAWYKLPLVRFARRRMEFEIRMSKRHCENLIGHVSRTYAINFLPVLRERAGLSPKLRKMPHGIRKRKPKKSCRR